MYTQKAVSVKEKEKCILGLVLPNHLDSQDNFPLYLFQSDTVGYPGAKKCLGNGEEEKNRKQTETALSDWFLHYEYYEVYKITCPQKYLICLGWHETLIYYHCYAFHLSMRHFFFSSFK